MDNQHKPHALLAACLKNLREFSGLKWSNLSERTGIHEQRLRRLESGKYDIYGEEIIILCRVYGIDIYKIFGGDLIKVLNDKVDTAYKIRIDANNVWGSGHIEGLNDYRPYGE